MVNDTNELEDEFLVERLFLPLYRVELITNLDNPLSDAEVLCDGQEILGE